MLKTNGHFLRIVSLFLIGAFCLQEVSYSAPPSGGFSVLQKPIELISQDPTRFEVPLDLSSLKEIHKDSSGYFIIHIQDAHSNLSGQENLAKTLDAIMTKYGVSLILVEGGAIDGTLDVLKTIASPEITKRAAKSLLIEGQIAGEEYLNLTSNHPMKIMGIEDMDLYDQSLQNYAKLADKKETILQYLQTIQSAMDKLKRKLYPKELLEYEKLDNQDFEKKFKKLVGLASGNVVIKDQVNLRRLLDLQKKESTIHFEAANLEQASLIEEIRKKGGTAYLGNFLSKSNELKNNTISQFAHFQTLFEIAKKSNVPFSQYPNLILYGNYLEEFSTLNLEKILEEWEHFEDKTYVSLLPQEDQRIVRSIDRYLGLLKTAYKIQMSSKDFLFFKANEPDFATMSYLAFINQKLMELGYFKDLIPYENHLEEGKEALEAFYQSVSQRDNAFIQNTEKIMQQENQKVAVLIAGGYHTQNLTKLLSERNHSFAVLTPNVESETNQKKYEKLLLSELPKGSKKEKIQAPPITPGSDKLRLKDSPYRGIDRLFALEAGIRLDDPKVIRARRHFEKILSGKKSGIHVAAGARMAEGIDLNQPDLEQLRRELSNLNLLSKGTVQAIIKWRTTNGLFTNSDSLAGIRGIGPLVLSQLRLRLKPIYLLPPLERPVRLIFTVHGSLEDGASEEASSKLISTAHRVIRQIREQLRDVDPTRPIVIWEEIGTLVSAELTLDELWGHFGSLTNHDLARILSSESMTPEVRGALETFHKDQLRAFLRERKKFSSHGEAIHQINLRSSNPFVSELENGLLELEKERPGLTIKHESVSMDETINYNRALLLKELAWKHEGRRKKGDLRMAFWLWKYYFHYIEKSFGMRDALLGKEIAKHQKEHPDAMQFVVRGMMHSKSFTQSIEDHQLGYSEGKGEDRRKGGSIARWAKAGFPSLDSSEGQNYILKYYLGTVLISSTDPGRRTPELLDQIYTFVDSLPGDLCSSYQEALLSHEDLKDFDDFIWRSLEDRLKEKGGDLNAEFDRLRQKIKVDGARLTVQSSAISQVAAPGARMSETWDRREMDDAFAGLQARLGQRQDLIDGLGRLRQRFAGIPDEVMKIVWTSLDLGHSLDIVKQMSTEGIDSDFFQSVEDEIYLWTEILDTQIDSFLAECTVRHIPNEVLIYLSDYSVFFNSLNEKVQMAGRQILEDYFNSTREDERRELMKEFQDYSNQAYPLRQNSEAFFDWLASQEEILDSEKTWPKPAESNRFRNQARRWASEYTGIPANRILFMPSRWNLAWRVLVIKKIKGLRGGYGVLEALEGSDGKKIDFIVLDSSAYDHQILHVMVHEAEHALQKVNNNLFDNTPFTVTVVEGFQYFREYKALNDIAKRRDAFGSSARRLMRAVATGRIARQEGVQSTEVLLAAISNPVRKNLPNEELVKIYMQSVFRDRAYWHENSFIRRLLVVSGQNPDEISINEIANEGAVHDFYQTLVDAGLRQAIGDIRVDALREFFSRFLEDHDVFRLLRGSLQAQSFIAYLAEKIVLSPEISIFEGTHARRMELFIQAINFMPLHISDGTVKLEKRERPLPNRREYRQILKKVIEIGVRYIKEGGSEESMKKELEVAIMETFDNSLDVDAPKYDLKALLKALRDQGTDKTGGARMANKIDSAGSLADFLEKNLNVSQDDNKPIVLEMLNKVRDSRYPFLVETHAVKPGGSDTPSKIYMAMRSGQKSDFSIYVIDAPGQQTGLIKDLSLENGGRPVYSSHFSFIETDQVPDRPLWIAAIVTGDNEQKGPSVYFTLIDLTYVEKNQRPMAHKFYGYLMNVEVFFSGLTAELKSGKRKIVPRPFGGYGAVMLQETVSRGVTRQMALEPHNSYGLKPAAWTHAFMDEATLAALLHISLARTTLPPGARLAESQLMSNPVSFSILQTNQVSPFSKEVVTALSQFGPMPTLGLVTPEGILPIGLGGGRLVVFRSSAVPGSKTFQMMRPSGSGFQPFTGQILSFTPEDSHEAQKKYAAASLVDQPIDKQEGRLAEDAAREYQIKNQLSKTRLAAEAKAIPGMKYVLLSISFQGQDPFQIARAVQILKNEIRQLRDLTVFFEWVDEKGQRIEVYNSQSSDPIPTNLPVGQTLERIYLGVLSDALVLQAISQKAGYLPTEETLVDKDHYKVISHAANMRAAILSAITDPTNEATRYVLTQLMQISVESSEAQLIKKVIQGTTVQTYQNRNLIVKALGARLSAEIYRTYVNLTQTGSAA